jgi:hypothetical protein
MASLIVRCIKDCMRPKSKKTKNDVPSFGEEMRRAEFSDLAEDVAFLNNASFGVAPSYVLEKRNE